MILLLVLSIKISLPERIIIHQSHETCDFIDITFNIIDVLFKYNRYLSKHFKYNPFLSYMKYLYELYKAEHNKTLVLNRVNIS